MDPAARLSLHATTSHAAALVPMLVADQVQAIGGWVTDVHAFGTLQVVVSFIVPGKRARELEHILKGAGLRVYEATWGQPEARDEVAGAITVTPNVPLQPLPV